ncbi:hypothetical protein BKA62DRAFT_706194 [Auriculariales sp. MPI-PUGE-AT-0066]|nr:hypothetical protein BKA62DRAFT_706194 [Auriculariales sp. MPI-PUGE-AT-0066]
MSLNLFPQHDGAPSLPACDNLGTLLVLNPRPAMPIHLCLSALRAAPHQARVLVITSSRFSWRDALVELNDQALNKLASDAITAHMLSRIDVFNVPSKRHLDVLLVALSVLTTTGRRPLGPFRYYSPISGVASK